MFKVLVSAAFIFMFLNGSVHAQQAVCKVTASQYKAIKAGMSYAQVTKILGCDGEELSSSEMAGFKTSMYSWSGKGSLGANMNIMVQNDEVVTKAQFGLQ